MKRFLGLAATAVLAIQHFALPHTLNAQNLTPPRCASSVVTGGSVANVWLFGNGQCYDLSSYISSVIPGLTWRMDTPLLTMPGATIRMSGFFDSDPSIDFAFSSTLTDASVRFTAFFYTPVMPDLYTAASAVGRVSITSGVNGSGQVRTDPTTNPTYILGSGLVGSSQTNLGVNTGSTPCSATGVAAMTSCAYGPSFSTFAPTFYDGLLAGLVYEQTGLGSFAHWDGTVTLTTSTSVVPEPASIVLFGAGLMVTAAFARRRRTRR